MDSEPLSAFLPRESSQPVSHQPPLQHCQASFWKVKKVLDWKSCVKVVLNFRVVSAYENKIVRPETRLGGWFLHNFGEPTFPKFVDVIIEGANDCDKVMMMIMMMRMMMIIVSREFVRAWMSTGSHSTPVAPTVTSSMTTSQKWVNLMYSETSFYCFSLKILEET